MTTNIPRRARLIICIAITAVSRLAGEHRSLPREPVTIGTEPQFLVDDYLVDNRWALQYDRGSREMVQRVFHAPVKHARNPLFAPPVRQPRTAPQQAPSWFSVVREPDSGLFRMWYQDNIPDPNYQRGTPGAVYTTAICYAESRDGLQWVLPKLGLVEWLGSKDNNVVWRGLRGRRAGELQIITQVPDEARRGYRYLMVYLEGGIHLVGSHDGLHWDKSSHQQLTAMSSDYPNNVLYDPVEQEFVMYCRAKDRYLVGGNRGEKIDTGESRRIARITSKELWTEWTEPPESILLADEIDTAGAFTAFYAMLVQRHGGVYWGLLHPFKWNTDIYAELAFSRDGLRFDRLPTRPRLIDLGPPGAWDSGLIFTASNWVEVGKEWWIYYAGFNGPHGARENEKLGAWRTGGIGVATIRKEGFIAMRGPEHGGVLCTRRLIWPGGGLFLNADARGGELKVRVSDTHRKVVPGFDYADGTAFSADDTAHEVKWNGRSLAEMQGRELRLEFFLREAELYTFRAGGAPSPPAGR